MERITAIILAMLMFQSQYDYVWCLFLIPLFLFMEQERELRRDNVLPYLALMVPVLPLPLFRRDQMEPSFVPRATRFVMSAAAAHCLVLCPGSAGGACTLCGKPVKPAHGHPAATVLLAVCVAVAGGRPAAVAAHPQLGL